MSQKQLFTLNIPDTDKPRIVILGGGFGGINLIKKLPGIFQIVLLDRYNYHTFQPLLYQVATAGLEPDSVAGPLRKIINKRKNVFFRMLSATSISAEDKIIYTKAGSLKYDYLVIATGAKVNYFNNADISKHSFPLKQVTHALDLRSHIFQQFEKLEVLHNTKDKDAYLTFVIVGAGPTGVEISGALAELKAHVLPKDYPDLDMKNVKIYLIEGLDRVLPGMSEQSGKKAQSYLEKMEVKVILNCLTKDFDGKVVRLSNGDEIRTKSLIWAAGVKGNVIDGIDAQSIKKGKLLVSHTNQLFRNKENNELYDDIFAIGDVAFMEQKDYPDGLPGLAQVAIQQGRHLAKNLNKRVKNQSLKAFRYKNKGVLATIGRNKAVADLPNIKLTGFPAWFVWMVVHVLFLVSFRSKVIALTNWIWNYFTYDRGIRLIIRPSSKLNDILSQGLEDEMNETYS